MTDQAMPNDVVPAYRGSDTAPFLYFDAASTYGHLNGVLQMELTAHSLNPGSAGMVVVQHVVTAHLRCSVAAAINLRDALNQAIEMAQKPTGDHPVSAAVN